MRYAAANKDEEQQGNADQPSPIDDIQASSSSSVEGTCIPIFPSIYLLLSAVG